MVCERNSDVTGPQAPASSDADDVERHACPRCLAQPGSPCRSRSGAAGSMSHSGRPNQDLTS